jgi:hypothetical protein
MIDFIKKYLLTIFGFTISFYITYLFGKKSETVTHLKEENKKRDIKDIENAKVQKIINNTNHYVASLNDDDVRNELRKKANNNTK